MASLVAGIVSARTCENTVKDSRIVTPEIGSKIQALESIHKLCCSNPQMSLSLWNKFRGGNWTPDGLFGGMQGSWDIRHYNWKFIIII